MKYNNVKQVPPNIDAITTTAIIFVKILFIRSISFSIILISIIDNIIKRNRIQHFCQILFLEIISLTLRQFQLDLVLLAP